MNLKSKSIKLKLLMYFIVVSVILLLSIGLLFFKSNKTAVKDSKKKELKTLGEETGNKVERFLFERYGDIEVMSASPVLTREDFSDNTKLEYIKSIRNAYKTYDYILTTDENGKIKVASGDVNGDQNYKKWINYVLKGKIFISDFIYLPERKSYVIYLLAPLTNSKGAINGVVVERVNFESIGNIVENVKLDNSGYAYLASDTGSTIFYPKNGVKPNINLKINGEDIYYTMYNNKQFVYTFYSLNKYDTQKNNWYIVLEQPEREAFKVSYSLRSYTIILVIISIFIIFILALITSDRITRPFNVMTSNLKTMEQRVIKISDELEKSVIRAKNLEALAAMSAGMAHEIRNPLTSIRGYAEYIQFELKEEDKLQEDIEIIIDEVDRLNRIVDKFLNFARPKELSLKPENINDVARVALKVIEKEVNKNNIKVSIQFSKIPLVLMDVDQIQQVLLNILANSIQAMSEGGALGIVTGLEKELNMVYIEISDTGIGIKPEDYDKIFEPFFTTKDKGVGLGLSICSRIIENHKGFMEVESNLNKGSKFTIKLPVIETKHGG
ncbi:ATP-binding protein [Clostridium thailandense]|uniref:sensor histidine kinase n=1 Tax=Clostridium thailandense TaxID=2794346 RepID=UPI003988D13A